MVEEVDDEEGPMPMPMAGEDSSDTKYEIGTFENKTEQGEETYTSTDEPSTISITNIISTTTEIDIKELSRTTENLFPTNVNSSTTTYHNGSNSKVEKIEQYRNDETSGE